MGINTRNGENVWIKKSSFIRFYKTMQKFPHRTFLANDLIRLGTVATATKSYLDMLIKMNLVEVTTVITYVGHNHQTKKEVPGYKLI